MDWLLNGFIAGRSPDLPVGGCSPAKAEHLTRYQQMWDSLCQHYTGPVADTEDWIEMMARITAAVDVLGYGRCWLNNPAAGVATNLADGRVIAAGSAEWHALRWWGPVPNFGPAVGDGDLQSSRVDHSYVTTRTFDDMAGRHIAIVTSDDLGSAFDHARELSHDDAVWIKVNRPKYLVSRYDQDEAWDMDEEMLLAAIHLEGEPNAFLVYPHVTMEYETRFFVVDGVAVTAAGCVEHLTPVDNEKPFDVKMERERYDGEVQAHSEIMAQYLPFVQKAVAGFRSEGLLHYTLDVAMGVQGPLVIELNGLLNSGLYASDPKIMVKAIDQM